MKGQHEIHGALVTLPARGAERPLDGFWTRGARRSKSLLVFVHGMHSNFYRSALKKEFMARGPRRGYDVLSFNNRGAESDTETERFRDSLDDLDAAIAFGRAKGYRRFVLVGHSTGCQKIAYWQFKRQSPAIEALVLAAIGDDYAIARRDLGKKYFQRLETARRWISNGWKTRRMPDDCRRFTAERFLSAADPKQLEGRLFNLAGPLKEFRQLRVPILALFPADEEYACIPVAEAAQTLKKHTRSRRFGSVLVPGANHSFRGAEELAVSETLDWLTRTKAKRQ